MTKKIEKSIEEIRTFALVSIPAMIGKGIDEDAYIATCRMQLNLLLIQFVTGSNVKERHKPKGSAQFKLKFDAKLPKLQDINKVAAILDQYVEQVEGPFYERLQAQNTTADPDDMSITYAGGSGPIPAMKKVKAKAFNEMVFPTNDATPSIATMFLDSSNMIQLAAIGEKLRKQKHLKTALVIGGISIVVAAGVITAIILYRKYKHSHSDADPELAALEGDLTPEDGGDVVVDETTPVEID